MADYLTINTALKNPDGTGRTGTLYALLTARTVLVGGDVIGPGRQAFTVTAGVAAGLSLGITEDSNPSGLSYWFSFIDANGRKEDIGSAVVPRSDAAVNLNDILTVGEL